MSSATGLASPGADLCALPVRPPPDGEFVDFNNPGLKGLIISVSVTITTVTAIFALGRLYNNIRSLRWGDLFVLLSLLCNIAFTALMIAFVRLFRHSWDVRLCWFGGQNALADYVWQILLNFSLLSGKMANLLLLRQTFTISRPMRVAISVGMAITLVVYGAYIATISYHDAPHAGQTWDQYAASGKTIFPLYLGIAGSAVNVMMDIFILVLPLPIIYSLNMSIKRKVQLVAVFFTAVLGVVASTVSLVYRVKSIQSTESDPAYNAGIMLLSSLVEMDMALIVASVVGFAGFMRTYVMNSRAIQALRLTLSASNRGSNGSNVSPYERNPNRPRTGRENDTGKRRGVRSSGGYVEMTDAWLLNSGVTVDAEESNIDATSNRKDSSGLTATRTEDIKQELRI